MKFKLSSDKETPIKAKSVGLENSVLISENIKEIVDYFGDDGIETLAKILSSSLNKSQFEKLKDEINSTYV